MNTPDLPRLIERFQAYVAGFLNGDGNADYHFLLKREHTLRVLDNARTIAREEDLPPDLNRLAELAALFHDTGRFPQFARYGTFSDRHSANHAKLGVSALLASDLLDGLPAVERRTVLGAVFLHNVRSLPAGLPGTLNTVTRVVRDADKLDIYPILLGQMEGDKPLDPVISLGIRREPGRYTPQILELLERRQLATYDLMAYENDFRLLVAGWVFDLNFAASRRLLARRGYIDRVFEGLPDDPRLKALRRIIDEELAKESPAAA